jgi:hypothetical protein
VGRFAFFTRYVDIDPDGNINDAGNDWFDGSADSGWGYSPASAGQSHGLTVRSNQSNNNLLGFVASFSGDSGVDHYPCHLIANTTPMKGDQAVMYVWAPGNLSDTVPAHGKVTQTLESPDLTTSLSERPTLGPAFLSATPLRAESNKD